MIREISKLKFCFELFTPKIRCAVMSIPEPERSRIQEIRLRLGKKLSVTIFAKEYFVSTDGKLMSNVGDSVSVDEEDILCVYQKAFHNSLHCFSREISRGYITVEGGSRVGFCGTAVLNPANNYAVDTVKNISSVNIRIAREVIGCAEDIYQRAFPENLKGLLIAGPPSSGKTTVLRDLTRMIGEKYRVSLIDERNELSATVGGRPQNLVGVMTDVFNSYNKYEGIMTAVKVMSPQYLICDEIGGDDDFEALRYAINSGVKIICTCHAEDYKSAMKRKTVMRLVKNGAFDCCAVLGTGVKCGKLVTFSKIGEKND